MAAKMTATTANQANTEPSQQETDDRPRDGDQEFRSRMRRFFAHLCDTAEDEEGDLADGNTITKGDQGMTEFVQEDRCKQQQRRHAAHAPISRLREAREHVGQISGGKRPGHKEKNKEPRGVDMDRNPEHATNLPIRSLHGFTVAATSTNRQLSLFRAVGYTPFHANEPVASCSVDDLRNGADGIWSPCGGAGDQGRSDLMPSGRIDL